jgi:hypothetical protein
VALVDRAIRYVVVGVVLSAVTPSGADERSPSKYRMVHHVFVGSRLIPCDRVPGMSQEDCRNTQDYLGSATWQFAAAASIWRHTTIPRSWVEPAEIEDLLKHRAPELPLQDTTVADIYTTEGKRLVECLRGDCAKVISMTDHTPELWATIIDLSIPYLVCLDGPYAREEFRQIWQNGGWNRFSQHDFRFQVAAADELRSCPRNGLPDETFSFAARISYPFGPNRL